MVGGKSNFLDKPTVGLAMVTRDHCPIRSARFCYLASVIFLLALCMNAQAEDDSRGSLVDLAKSIKRSGSLATINCTADKGKTSISFQCVNISSSGVFLASVKDVSLQGDAKIELSDGQTLQVKSITILQDLGIAAFCVESECGITVADSAISNLAESVLIFSCPYGFPSVVVGMVSAVDTKVPSRFFHCDAAIGPGTYAGIVYDRQGKLLGIVSPRKSEKGTVVVPIHVIYERLKKVGESLSKPMK